MTRTLLRAWVVHGTRWEPHPGARTHRETDPSHEPTCSVGVTFSPEAVACTAAQAQRPAVTLRTTPNRKHRPAGVKMTRMLIGAWVVAWGAVAVAPWPAFAQEGEPTRSIGVSVSPRLAIHDETTCCSGIGAWLQIRRFQIDYSVAIDTWSFDGTVDSIDHFNELGYAPDAVPRRLSGHAMTVLFDLMTWNERRYAARFRIGGGYRVALDDVPFLRSREAELRRHHGIHLGPPVKHWGTINVSLTFDFTVGKKGVVRAGLSSSLPFLEPEPRLGAGWRF